MNTEISPPSRTLWKIFSDATFVLAIASLGGFIITYVFEISYCWHYEIPFEMIEVSLYNTFMVVGILLIIFDGAFQWIGILSWRALHPIRLLITFTGFTALPTVILFLLSGDKARWFYYILPFISLISGIIGLSTRPIFTQRQRKAYLQQLRETDAVENRFQHGHLLYVVVGRQAVEAFQATLGIILLILICTYSMGVGRASSKSTFNVIDTKPKNVVIRIYGNYLICAVLSNDSSNTYSSFQLIDKATLVSGQYKITARHLGRLKYVKPPEEMEQSKGL